MRLTDGETVEPSFSLLLCEVKDCMLVEREIYTALTEKECNKCG
nr:MAG TPA: YhfH-like protein [Caudoviricetes sp.]